MITIDRAKKIAENHISDAFYISSISEGNLYWYFGLKNAEGFIVPGVSPLAIDKKTGHLAGMPSVPYYIHKREPLPIELDYESSTTVM
ncbi:hypothetical protein [Adlercreutzia agrestimuris]|uniref:hypothetical protein n=1 Tax=Adlercreutzia agrestimuris TaxID=2941324 RepID=UPI00203C0CCE|nr:hypothetical protein [Adlercreutzia agrestimuris]